ncbi:MAG: hypothetical protein JST19_19895, partial [Bacteroidetes bacterium]|nr:hypothetical protein [Bacteroidota bacterium]
MAITMHVIKKLSLAAALVGLFSTSYAQIEVAHLSSKGFSSSSGLGPGIGFGGFLNVAIPIDDNNAGIVEGAGYVFSNSDSHVLLVPAMVGFRHLLSGYNDYGFYAEPVAGYTFGATDIQAYDANGQALYK